jgi:cobalt/nickel transport system permease protein
VFSEGVARRDGYLQRLDARTKLLAMLALIVAASFLHHVLSLLFVAAFAAAAAARSRVRARDLLNRVWLFAPAAFVLVALPAVLNVVTPGQPLLVLARFGPQAHLGPIALPAELSVTRQGVASASLVVTRVLVGVLLAVTLALTTRWQDLLKAAHTSASAPFVLTVSMMHRYLFVLVRVMEAMHLGRRARTIGRAAAAEERRWVGSRIGALFLRSRRLTEQVYAAMRARGYDGDPRTLVRSRFTAQEAGWGLACLLVAAAALVADRTLLARLVW